MNKGNAYFRVALLSLVLLVAMFTCVQSNALANSHEGTETNNNELLVKYAESSRSIASVSVLSGLTEDSESIAPSVELLKFPESANMDKIIKQLEANPLIETIEPNYERQLMAAVNDSLYPSQWWVRHVKAERFWLLAEKQKKSTVVAVIDSGIDRNHPDLVGRIAAGGFNFINQTSDVTDDNGHGTSVSGVIAANTNNGIGIAGVSGPYNVSVLPLKTVGEDGFSSVADNVKAIDYAIRKKVDVINISLGGATFSTFEQDAIQRAVDAGILIVAAAGNEAQKGNLPIYPASYEAVLSVGSIGKMNTRSAFSNFNNFIDIVAPGEQIYTTARNNSYSSLYGTSFSTPIVAGTVAMMKAVVPEITIQQTMELLASTAIDLGTPGKDAQYGYGLLDIEKISNKLANWNVAVADLKLSKTDVSLTIGDMTRLSVEIVPADATNQRVIWSSSNSLIASVNQAGEVVAENLGLAEIMATTEDGQRKKVALVTVNSSVQFEGDFPDLTIDDSKIFSVNFNKELDGNSSYGQHIFISKTADGQGEHFTSFQARVNPGKPTQLFIAPYTNWEMGIYYLIIQKGVVGADGKKLGQDVRVRFIVSGK